MKGNLILVLGILLVFSFIFMGCPNDTTENENAPTVTGVNATVANNTTSVAKGGTLQFSASVVGTNNP
jgi:hypothetical protein